MTSSPLLFGCILLSSGASFFLKLAAGSSSGELKLLVLVLNPLLWVGGLLYAAAFVGYLYVLRIVPLTLAQPVITAGVSVVTTLLAVALLHEHMQAVNWMGLCLICVGIFCLFLGRP